MKACQEKKNVEKAIVQPAKVRQPKTTKTLTPVSATVSMSKASSTIPMSQMASTNILSTAMSQFMQFVLQAMDTSASGRLQPK
uniref:Uncharacterized protein n=1 Tax=Romanomermis culicivorax TaxID=13658 RepID=A0A915K9X1_ROMCU